MASQVRLGKERESRHATSSGELVPDGICDRMQSNFRDDTREHLL